MGRLEKELGKELFNNIDETFRYIKAKKIDLKTYDKRFKAFNDQMALAKVKKETIDSINQVYYEIRRSYLWGDFK